MSQFTRERRKPVRQEDVPGRIRAILQAIGCTFPCRVKERDVATLRETAAGGFLAVARVVKTQGRRGEGLAEILTGFPERFQNLTRAYIERPGHTPDPLRCPSTGLAKGGVG